MYCVTDEQIPIITAIMVKCHKEHIRKRLEQNKKPLSSYVYNYSFSMTSAKEHLIGNSIDFTFDEKEFIRSYNKQNKTIYITNNM